MQNLYLVVEPSQIVALDLAHAIRVFDPQGEVRLVKGPGEALAVMAGTRPVAVFLHQRQDNDPGLRALRETGVPIAFTGPGAESVSGSDPVLDSPFTEATVAALLRQLLRQSVAEEEE